MKVKCSFCKTYIPKNEALRIGIQSFCSHEHYVESRSNKSPSPAPSMSQNDRLNIIESDGFRCRFCGRENYLHVHHIKYRSEGGSDDSFNLITLCGKHHDLVHSDKKRFQPLCLKLVELRESYSIKDLSVPHLEEMIQRNELDPYVSKLES